MKKTIVVMLAVCSIAVLGCDDAQEHRDKMKYLNEKGEPKSAEEIKAEEDAGIVYYEDEAELPDGPVQEIFKIGSDLAVENGGKNATIQIIQDVYATEIWTYHYNGGEGAPGGTIKMIAEDGTVYGPWQASSKNTFYWVAYPKIEIPAGKYTVIDSDPGTWSQNSESKGMGMTWMNGIYK